MNPVALSVADQVECLEFRYRAYLHVIFLWELYRILETFLIRLRIRYYKLTE